jgi:ribonucleoside-diphosphate reductase beta chain
VKDEAEKDELFNALEVFLLLRKKQTGLWNWISSFAERLIAFAAVEGIFLLRCILFYWLKNVV